MSSTGFLRTLSRRVASSGLLPTRGGGGAPYPGSNYKAASSAVRAFFPNNFPISMTSYLVCGF